MNKKICTICNQEKDLSEFYQRKKSKYYSSECKECTKTAARKYRADNKEIAISYRERNKDRIREYKKKYLEENKEKMYAYNKEYIANRLKTDHTFRAIHYYRSRMRKVLERGKASVESMDLLGCSADCLQRWLNFNMELLDIESKDIGPIYHCDHVRPCASFDMSIHDNVKKCFNWKNLQWLVSSDNLSKSDSINHKHYLFHELRLKIFEKREKQTPLYEDVAFRNYPWKEISNADPQGNLVKLFENLTTDS